MPPILDKLNPEQRCAVTTTEGPVLVLAGAGTGKTRVITHRIAHILGIGVPPACVLAVTFTNKAAGEMRERAGGLVAREKVRELTIGTFHSFCVRQLRRHAELLGFPRTFTICDESDQLAAVKGALRELRVGEAVIHPNAVLAKISLAKNRLLTCDEYLEAAADDVEELVGRAWKRYDAQLRRSRTLDFDDLLLRMVELLREHEAVRLNLADRYRYVMVDEYQDTNGPQYEIVRQLAGAHRNLCVVGDDDQSIYGWRGADVRKILHFERDFPGCTVVRLERNYRSTRQILEAANAVIGNNPTRHAKTLRSELGDGPEVTIQQLDDEEAEAEHVVKEILAAISRREARHGEFAILFRTAVQPRAFEAQLRARGVPYTLVGGPSFFDRKEVRDVLAFAKLLVNPDDEVSLLRVVNVPPRGVGDASVDRVLAYATEHGITAGAAFDAAERIPGVPPTAATAVRTLREKLAALGAEDPGKRLVEVLRTMIRQVNYAAEIERCYPEARDRDLRWSAVQEVLNFAENHVRRNAAPTLAAFLEELTLTGQDDRTSSDDRRRDAVTLMTLHAAKGLEFPRVYLVGLEEGLLPHARSVAEDGIEEERRLMYVGITRAQHRLTISHVVERARYGRRAASMPSRFLFEITGESPPPGWRPAGSAAPVVADEPAEPPAEERKPARRARGTPAEAKRPPGPKTRRPRGKSGARATR